MRENGSYYGKEKIPTKWSTSDYERICIYTYKYKQLPEEQKSEDTNILFDIALTFSNKLYLTVRMRFESEPQTTDIQSVQQYQQTHTTKGHVTRQHQIGKINATFSNHIQINN